MAHVILCSLMLITTSAEARRPWNLRDTGGRLYDLGTTEVEPTLTVCSNEGWSLFGCAPNLSVSTPVWQEVVRW